MQTLKPLSTLLCLFTTLCLCACGSDGGDNSAPTNTAPELQTGSHNAGQNCMSSSCHDGNHESAAAFTVAGTIYSSGTSIQPNATVRLYIHNTNTLVAELNTDASGNFYTSDAIDGLADGSGALVSGADVEVEGPSGNIRTMPGLITSGACSGCHGQSNGRVTVN